MTRRYLPPCTVVMFLVVGSLVCSLSLLPAFGQVRLQRLLEHHVLMVVDANAKIVGQVIENSGGNPKVYFTINGQPVLLQVDGAQLEIGQSTVFFASTNCTGQGFIRSFDPTVSLYSPAAVLPPGKTVYLPVPGSRAQTLTLRSQWVQTYDRPGVNTCSQLDFPYRNTVSPVQPVVNLNKMFTPPFRLQVMTTTQP